MHTANSYREPVVQTAINLVSAPMGFAGRGAGQERLAVPEGLRDEDLRVFWYPGTISSLHYGLADGDLIVPGALGPVTNTFNGDSRLQAESFRNQYASIAPGWFARYQADSSQLTRLTGFGASVFELYDAVEGHWILAPTYQAVNAANWGSFTEVLGVRKDPGNV